MQFNKSPKHKSNDQQFEEFLLELPPEYHQLAYGFKALARARKIKTPQQLLRIVFLYTGLDKTLRETAAVHTLLYGTITDEAVRKRLLACEPWLRVLLQRMLPELPPSLPHSLRFRIFDASNIPALAPKGHDFRLHLGIDLPHLRISEFILTDQKTGETLKNFALTRGDVAIVDRGYCHHLGILYARSQGAHVLGRLNPSTVRLLSPDREKFDLISHLKQHRPHTPCSFEVRIGGKSEKKPVKAWVHAQRVPIKIKRQREEKYIREKKRNGKKPRQTDIYLLGWYLVFSTVSPEILSAKDCLKLYRTRWQIELVFKRCKSKLGYKEMRVKRDSQLAMVWLLGKALYTMCLDRKLRKKLEMEWGMFEGRIANEWRMTSLLHSKYQSVILASNYWRDDMWEKATIVLSERTRKRRQQLLDIEYLKDIF